MRNAIVSKFGFMILSCLLINVKDMPGGDFTQTLANMYEYAIA